MVPLLSFLGFCLGFLDFLGFLGSGRSWLADLAFWNAQNQENQENQENSSESQENTTGGQENQESQEPWLPGSLTPWLPACLLVSPCLFFSAFAWVFLVFLVLSSSGWLAGCVPVWGPLAGQLISQALGFLVFRGPPAVFSWFLLRFS